MEVQYRKARRQISAVVQSLLIMALLIKTVLKIHIARHTTDKKRHYLPKSVRRQIAIPITIYTFP